MLYEMKKLGLESAAVKAHEKKFGAYNDLPPGWRQITSEELMNDTRFRSYTPSHTEFRQITRDKDGNHKGFYLTVRMFHFEDGTGVAFASKMFANDPEIRYFAFGCEHEWGGEMSAEEKSQCSGNQMHGYKCKLCGHFEVHDSSD